MNNSNSEAVRIELDINEMQKRIDSDTEVASVPLDFFSVSQNKYVHAAQSRISYIEDKLFETNTTRHEIMARMGSRWKNNPHPSNEYADKKKTLERELTEALDGMNRTQRMDVSSLGGASRSC